MKKTSTAATANNKNLHRTLTTGLDLGDRSSWYCVLDEVGEVIGEQKLTTTLRLSARSLLINVVIGGDGLALTVGLVPTTRHVCKDLA